MRFSIYVVMATALAALILHAIRQYRAVPGSIADKLAAAWKDSLTIFVLAWGAVLTGGVELLDLLSQVTGDQQFASFADSVKEIIPAQYHAVIPPVIMGIGIAARLTHNPPTPRAGK